MNDLSNTAGAVLQAVDAHAAQVKQDATNSVQALRNTANALDAHAVSLKEHLTALVGEAEAQVEVARVHWPWLVAAAIAGAMAAHFVFGF